MTDQQLLAILDHVGGWVRWDELLYQVNKQNGQMSEREVWDRLRALRGQGSVRADTYFAVGKPGENVPERRREAA